MEKLQVLSYFGENIGQDIFGVNYLFDNNTIENGSDFQLAFDSLNSELLRFPGGANTERLFDISDPDKSSAYDYEQQETVEITPISEFFSFASDNNLEVNLVIPTNGLMTKSTDQNGDRFPDFDEDILTKFVSDVLTGDYGDAKIKSFEIGNEYWGSGGMSSVEYGRLASEMSKVIDNAIERIPEDSLVSSGTKILVQSGTNFQHANLNENYEYLQNGSEILNALSQDYGIQFDATALWSSGDVNWSTVNDQIIYNQFESNGSLENFDGVVAHVYSRGEDVGAPRDAFLNQIQKTWLGEEVDKEIHITEWNQKAGTDLLDAQSDYGMHQAHEMLNIIESFSEYGVDAAYVWPLGINSKTSLSLPGNSGDLSPAGEMYKMMENSLVGTRPVDLVESNRGESEQSIGEVDAHTFYGEGKLVFYFASNSDEDSFTSVDISGIVDSFDTSSIVRLGVENSQNPGNTRSDAEVEELSAEDVFTGGLLEVDLGPLEILEVILIEPELTEHAREAFGPTVDDDVGPIIPDVPEEPVDLEEETEWEEELEDDYAGLEMLFAVLPLLGMAFAFGG